MNKKKCSKCGKKKELSAFYSRTGCSSKLHAQCKKCISDKGKIYRLNNDDKIRKYRNKDIENQKIRQFNYYRENKQSRKEYQKIRHKQLIDNLDDSYICNRLGININDCHPMLIEAKRAQLQLWRVVNEN